MHTIYIYICILFLCICIWIFIPKWCIWMYTIVHQHTKILCFKHETTAYFLSWLPDEWHLRSPPTHRLRRRYDANWIASAAGCCWFYPLKSSLLLPIWRWVKTRQNPPLVNIKIAGELIFKNTHVRRLNCHVCWFQPLEFWFTLPKVPFYWFQPVKSLPWYAGHSAVSHPFSMAFSSETNEDRPVSLSEINTANSNGTLSLSQLSPFKLIHIWILSNIIIQYLISLISFDLHYWKIVYPVLSNYHYPSYRYPDCLHLYYPYCTETEVGPTTTNHTATGGTKKSPNWYESCSQVFYTCPALYNWIPSARQQSSAIISNHQQSATSRQMMAFPWLLSRCSKYFFTRKTPAISASAPRPRPTPTVGSVTDPKPLAFSHPYDTGMSWSASVSMFLIDVFQTYKHHQTSMVGDPKLS